MDKDLFKAQENIIGIRIEGGRFLGMILAPQKGSKGEGCFLFLLDATVPRLDAWNSYCREKNAK